MGAAVGMAVAAAAAAKAAVVAAVAVVVGVRRGDPGRSRSELAVQTFERRWPALDASATGSHRMVRTPCPASRPLLLTRFLIKDLFFFRFPI